MRKLLVVAALFASATLAGAQDSISKDRETLLAHLDKTGSGLLASVDGLSEAQWNYRSAAGRWTIAEVVEHVAVTEKFIREAAAGSLKEKAAPDVLKDARKDEMILGRIPDRSTKVKTSETFEPKNAFGSPSGAVAAFKAERAETVKLARQGGNLREHGFQHPMFGNLDAYGWVLFQSAHSERHTKQIEEVKADPGYPKN